MRLRLWEDIIPEYKQDNTLFEIVVPTIESVRQEYCLSMLLSKQKNVLFTGATGVGKSLIIKNTLRSLRAKHNLISTQITFTALTSSSSTQCVIEEKLEKKRRDLYGAPVGNKIAVFIDDINMPSVDKYGTQPTIELLRMLIDKHGFYDREKLFWKWIEDITIICAGNKELSQRFTRRFNMICISAPNRTMMQQIYEPLLTEHMQQYTEGVKGMIQHLVNSTIDAYELISEKLKPIPSKFHYIFTLRDVSKVVNGIMMTRSQNVGSGEILGRLWIHEMCRVFYDRLSTEEDKEWIGKTIVQFATKYLKSTLEYKDIFINPKIYWGYINNSIYDEINDKDKLKEQLRDYCVKAELQLVLFENAIEHIIKISRVIRQPKGYLILIGTGGLGKKALTRLSSFIQNYTTKKLEDNDREDIKEILRETGIKATPTCLIVTNNTNESLLEDISSLLNNGEVPNLFKSEEKEKLMNDLKEVVPKLKGDQSKEDLSSLIVERLLSNLHIVFCMEPGEELRMKCRKFPSLIKCCTVNWVSNWSQSALLSISTQLLEPIDNITHIEVSVKEVVGEECVKIHNSVEEKAIEFYAKQGRRVYITPKSYLDLIALYAEILKKKLIQAENSKARFAEGIERLKETHMNINTMKERLGTLQSMVKENNEALEFAQKKADEEQRIVFERERIISAEKDVIDTKAMQVKELEDGANIELNLFKPEMASINNEVRQLDRKSLSEIKMFSNPPTLITIAMEAVMVLLEEKTDWNNIKAVLADAGEFISRLVNFNEKITELPESVIKKLRNNYLSNPEFDPEKVASKSLVAKTIVKWVRVINKYYDVLKKIEPKCKLHEEEKVKLEELNEELEIKLNELNEVKSKVNKLQEECNVMQKERSKLSDEIYITRRRLEKAEELINLLVEEDASWSKALLNIQELSIKFVGDALLSAAFISYLGPFTEEYRGELVNAWIESMKDKIPCTEDFSFIKAMEDQMSVRNWHSFGLAADRYPIENTIIAIETIRFPLIIDPQMQANKWIKQLIKPKIITKLTNKDFIQTLSNAIKEGEAVLCEDIHLEEPLDPVLDPLLLKELYKNKAGVNCIRIKDKDVEYNPAFKFFMIFKSSNPHYMPDVSAKTTIINFEMTFEGLEDQLLTDIVKKEKAEIEEQRDEVMRQLKADRKGLLNIEDNIIKLLANPKLEQILDGEDTIESIKNTKLTIKELNKHLIEFTKIEQKINEERDKYKNVATRGAIISFVISSLKYINHMYQYSFDYIKQIFNEANEENDVTRTMYKKIARGLFEEHRIAYAFMICIEIKKREGRISEEEWNCFIKEAPNNTFCPNPLPNHISKTGWNLALLLSDTIPKKYEELVNDFKESKDEWVKYATTIKIPNEWSKILTSFQKLLLIKIFRPELILQGVKEFIKTEMGCYFIEDHTWTIEEVYKESSNSTPIVLLGDVDSMKRLLKLAEDHSAHMSVISLGQGQVPIAIRLIEEAQVKGDWIVLQNCHLAEIRALKQIVEESFSLLHTNFRLFLISKAVDHFPASILQSALKLVIESPKSIKANLRETLIYEDSTEAFKKLSMGLCFFHSTIQQRSKFGQQGFNAQYEFTEHDLETSINTLRTYLNDYENIPWNTLIYMIGDINYGSRVIDEWDRRCLLATLKVFYTPKIFEEGYKFSESGIYHAPLYGTLEEYKTYIESSSLINQAEMFGMHYNANLIYQVNESNSLIKDILKTKTVLNNMNDDLVLERVAELLSRVPETLERAVIFL